jgi:diguanylate cyclase (GGDEF)-like protein/PAS domain S-box-containing protein
MKQISIIRRILLPLLLLGAVSILAIATHMFTLDMERIENRAMAETNKLSYILEMAQSLMSERVNSSMQLLKQNSLAQGKAEIVGTIVLNERRIPNLTFGSESQTEVTSLVDGVTSIENGTATLFVKDNAHFVRIATNVTQQDGARAVGTLLDPKGKVIRFLQDGKPFYGVVDILGEPYISGYEPIKNSNGTVIGAWYVGYKVNVHALEDAIKKWSFLKSGFAVITDYNHHIRFLSEQTSLAQATEALNNKKNDWAIIKKDIPTWDFQVYIVYPKSEAYFNSASNLYPLLLIGSVFGLGLLVLAYSSLRRFVLTPLGGNPDTASLLVERIAQGDFTDDGTRANAGTLIDNMVKMRKQLCEMVNELHENTERLSVSSSVFQHAHDGIFITDIHANITDVNPSFTKITGFSRAEAIGRNASEIGFIYENPTFFSDIHNATTNQGEWRGETWNQHKDGHRYASWFDIFPVYDNTKTLQHYVGLFSDITQAKLQQNVLEQMAYHDPLTQLPNRTLFADRIQQVLARAVRTSEMVAICYFDLDKFKPINDLLGHAAGDQLLIQLSARLRQTLRDSDTIARFGGDEFALLLCGLQTSDEYSKALDRVLTSIEQPFIIDGHTVEVSASMGYTVFPADNQPPDILLRHADHAMYRAKTNGGAHHYLFNLQSDLFTQQINT